MSRLPQAIVLSPTDAGLMLARSLHRRDVPVRILGERRGERAWITRTRFAKTFYVGQLPADTDGWLSQLEELARGGPGVLISTTDRTCEFLTAERENIPEQLRSFESPESAHARLMDKGPLYELADQVGARYPWSLRLASREELERVAAEATYPCLLKPALSHEWRRIIGDRRVIPLARPEDLAREAGPALDAGLELLVTEHVPGPDTNLEGASAIRRADGEYTLRFGRRKIRMYPPGFGAPGMTECVEIPETMAMTTLMLDAADFEGVAHLETKRHAETDERVLIEINVRVPQAFALGDACGTDASWRLYATLAGLPLPPQPPQVPGVKVIVPSLEPRAVISNLRERRATVRQILASYRGVRSLSGLSITDPAAALSFIGGQLKGGARFLGRRLRRDPG